MHTLRGLDGKVHPARQSWALEDLFICKTLELARHLIIKSALRHKLFCL